MRRNYIVRQGIFRRIMILAVAALLFFTNCGDRVHHHEDTLSVGTDRALLQSSGRRTVSNTAMIKAEFGTKVYEEEIPGVAGYDTRNLSSISSKDS
jgi:Cu(I)/Ag(I) efflux system membrane fusion protein